MTQTHIYRLVFFGRRKSEFYMPTGAVCLDNIRAPSPEHALDQVALTYDITSPRVIVECQATNYRQMLPRPTVKKRRRDVHGIDYVDRE